MHIGVFTDTYIPQINGVAISVSTFKEEFERLGHQVTVFCPKVKGATESTDDVIRFSSFTYPFQKEYQLALPVSRQLRRFKDFKVDVIHSHTEFVMGYLAYRMSRKYQIPLVHTYHTLWEEYVHYVKWVPDKWMKRWAGFESKRICERAQNVVVPTQQMKQQLEKYGVTVPISIIPTGVTPLSVSDTLVKTFAQTHSLNLDHPVFVYVGRLGIEKNVYFLLESFHQILDHHPHAQLLIIGDGPERENMECFVDELDISTHVRFTGYLDRSGVFCGFSLATLMLFPSKTESQGLSVVEAMSMGLPVVCINKMGVRDVLEGNKGGFLTEDSMEDYVKTVLRLLDDSE